MSLPLNPFAIAQIPNPFAEVQKAIITGMQITGIVVLLVIIVAIWWTWHNRVKIKQTVATGVKEGLKLAPLAIL